jgi:hypothetical protein
MTGLTRRWFLTLLSGAVVGSSGCNLASLAYFLMPEAREPAKFRNLASGDPKEDPRVVILTYTGGLETRAEFIHADRQLADLLGRHLTALAQANKEKLTVIAQRKVEQYKNSHPDWRRMDPAEVGRAFDADYVVYLEINALSMYEKGSANQFFRGRADVTVSLVDVHKPDEAPRQEAYNCIYPSDARGGIPVGFDAHPVQFRQAFLDHTAKQLSWYFSKYPRRERYMVD